MSEFEEIKGFSKYLINKEGKIFSKFYKKEIVFQIEDGYKRTRLIDDEGKRSNSRLHRLLALQYIPNPDNLECIDHIDRNRLNNSLDNLRWVSQRDNCRNMDENRKSKGSIFLDKSTTARLGKDYWKANIYVNYKHQQKSSHNREKLEEWLKSFVIIDADN
jgi:hypothetical protein